MLQMDQALEKLRILADSAKYDVSCSSSGVERKGKAGQMGSASEAGICHSWAADGRCISLLKVLFTNKCVYDCEYCVNRRSGDSEKASFEPRELAELTMEFYRRNYIEGLFLSSAVEVSPDHTAERILEVLWILREEFGFLGYIHAKIIPGVSPELVHRIGLLADRLSVNVELPSDESLARLAPQKKPKGIFTPMKQITETMAEQKTLKGGGNKFSTVKYRGQDLSYLDLQGGKQDPLTVAAALDYMDDKRGTLPFMVREEAARYGELQNYKEKFSPAGQTTQMIIGASPESDRQILKLSESMYKTFFMKRVYFSAYVPVVNSEKLPDVFTAPPLEREHRLYQADWLLRFYGFEADEILNDKYENLDLDVDPKVSWALRNIKNFPLEINKASIEELLRVPGIGNVSAVRIVRHRKLAAVKFDDLKKMGVVVKRAKYFITCCGKYYGDIDPEPETVRPLLGDGMSGSGSVKDGVLVPQGVRIKDDRVDVIRGKISNRRDGVQLSMFDGGFGGTQGGGFGGLSV